LSRTDARVCTTRGAKELKVGTREVAGIDQYAPAKDGEYQTSGVRAVYAPVYLGSAGHARTIPIRTEPTYKVWTMKGSYSRLDARVSCKHNTQTYIPPVIEYKNAVQVRSTKSIQSEAIRPECLAIPRNLCKVLRKADGSRKNSAKDLLHSWRQRRPRERESTCPC
jgi:hypothetical protein